MLSCKKTVNFPVLIFPRLANLLIFLLSRMTGNTEAGKTTNASDAKNQSLMKATTTSTISEVVSFKNEAKASVNAERKRVTSLVTREIRVPLGCREKKDKDMNCRCRASRFRTSW